MRRRSEGGLPRRSIGWPLAVLGLAVLGVAAWALLSARHAETPVQLIAGAAPGFVPDSAVSGALDLGAASRATLVPTAELYPQLQRLGFRSGTVRTWRRDDQFVEIAAFTLKDAAAARALQQLQLDDAASLPGGGVHAGPEAFFEVAGLPAARGFLANGLADSDGKPLFVQGVWFTVGRRAYLVETGAPRPASADFAIDLARRQHALAT